MSTANFQPRWTCKYRKPRNPIEAQDLYNHIRTVAYLLDSSSEWLIPAFPVLASLPPELHFGLESVIGAAVPTLGDIFGIILGLYQVFLSMFFGLSRNIIGWMLFYLVLDAFIGVIPVIGEFLDVAFKANLYNLRLLEKELKQSPRWAQAVIIPQYTDWIPRRKKGPLGIRKSWKDYLRS
ncbi:hypothetical protein Moror_14289 [Moniliophthora roreri MCA 2997]|uniref:DUF4112 domain-containing protein n=1 Tax=Moniliophthora roreri (strain MCA 2997) TaxID=1381753 RepID=V2X685_MONRO|nr:hypothetical protein Moror_14289 [Moniliophthora roreri MCA 2997]